MVGNSRTSTTTQLTLNSFLQLGNVEDLKVRVLSLISCQIRRRLKDCSAWSKHIILSRFIFLLSRATCSLTGQLSWACSDLAAGNWTGWTRKKGTLQLDRSTELNLQLHGNKKLQNRHGNGVIRRQALGISSISQILQIMSWGWNHLEMASSSSFLRPSVTWQQAFWLVF